MDADPCPTCGKPAVMTCRCPLRDSECPAGHQWHRCFAHRVVVAGPADHARDTTECRCPAAARNPCPMGETKRIAEVVTVAEQRRIAREAAGG
jgi:hypothetical protein